MPRTTPRSKSCRSSGRQQALAASLLLSLTASLLLAGCATPPPETLPETLLSGETMGSAWTVKIAGDLPLPAAELQPGAQAQFEAVNQALSTYRADSALSRFNASDSRDWVEVDPELAAVLRYALTLAERSGGAYDVTVGPLVNLWGFGPDPATNRVPDAAAIEAARALVGWRKVEVDPVRDRARKPPGMRIDLSSLGKGRGVDRVAEYLDAQGVTNYLIDLSDRVAAHPDADLMVVRLTFPHDQFDANADYSQDQLWRLLAYNWTDINGDGNLWTDNDGDGAVDHANLPTISNVDFNFDIDFAHSEMDKGEYVRFMYHRAYTNSLMTFVRDPADRMADGLFLGLQHAARTASIRPPTPLPCSAET